MLQIHGVRGETASTSIQHCRYQRRPAPPLAGHGSLRGVAAISKTQRPSLPTHYPPQELRQIVPLAETTIYEMERRGEFPRRFNLTPRCVVWDLAEVEAWVEERKQRPRGGISKPDVHQRKTRPVRAGSSQA